MKKKLIALAVFVGVGLILLTIPFSKLFGADQTFSLFDFFAPAAGAMLTSIWGAASVILVKALHALITGQTPDMVTIIRLFPLACAALYFGARRYRIIVALIPLACMTLFIMHPEGRQAWYYSLYWLIPVVAAFAQKSLVLKSLGATFTAHAIGGVTFLYALNLPAEVWIALIPIVFIERMMFTGGIALSYVGLNSFVNWLYSKFRIPLLERFVQPEYLPSQQLMKNL